MRKLFALLGVLAVTILAACEDECGTTEGCPFEDGLGQVLGRVFVGGEPREGIEVLLGDGKITQDTTQTNSEGQFSFSGGVSRRAYIISATLPTGTVEKVYGPIVFYPPDRLTVCVNLFFSEKVDDWTTYQPVVGEKYNCPFNES